MKNNRYIRSLFFNTVCTLLCFGTMTNAYSESRIDTPRADAPALAAYGDFSIGVRQLEVTNPSQIDILALDTTQAKPEPLPLYDRPLTLEVWYPADKNSEGNTVLQAYIRDGKKPVALHGKAVRNAPPFEANTPFPLVLISHGYPGNRFLLAHLAENIASKGYVVVSVDHTDSTYRTQAAFSSTLVNRPIDQLFVVSHIEALAQQGSSFLHQLVNANNTAIVGYSMGGYGAVINAGAGLTEQAITSQLGAPFGLLSRYQTGKVDSRIKTIVAFAPWGMNYGMFTLDSIAVPMMLIAGSQDDVSGYENGVRAIWEGADNVDRTLLTFNNANHNAGAVMPAPKESFVFDEALGFNTSTHYIDAVWDNTRMNNIAQHFVTVWLGKHLKSNHDMQAYLDLIPESNNGVWAMDKAGNKEATHTYWKGFAPRTAKGLKLEHLRAKE